MSVKPGVVSSVLQDVKDIASGKLFISVAMGITIREMEKVNECHSVCLLHFTVSIEIK